MSGTQVLLRLMAPDDARPVFLRLAPDAGRPAFVRSAGLALEYFGEPSAAQRGVLERIKGRLISQGELPLDEHAERLCRAFPALLPWRRWPIRFEPPRPWDHGHVPLLGALVPPGLDIELHDLRADTDRRLIKRELVDAGLAERTRLRWTQEGLSTVLIEVVPGRAWVIYGALEPELVQEALAHESHLHSSDAGAAAAVRWLGSALGYPACCVEAFLGLARRDDFMAAMCLIGPWPHGPYSPWTLWLDASLSPSSHFPCHLNCVATAERARQIVQLADTATVGLRERWLALARRVHLIDAQARHLALELDGDRVRSIVERQHHGGRVEHRSWPDPGPDLHLVQDGGVVRTTDDRIVAVVTADHRGPG